jgi:nitrous oxidase accessory protein
LLGASPGDGGVLHRGTLNLERRPQTNVTTPNAAGSIETAYRALRRDLIEEGLMHDKSDTMTGSRLGAGEDGVFASGVADGGTAPAAATGPRSVGASLWSKLLTRVLPLLAAAALLISLRYPYWNMKLSAPQYPRGLYLWAYPDRIAGDMGEIDGLNHYIGMRKIDSAAMMERRLGIPCIALVAACLVIAGLWPSRWAVLLMVPAILFPPLFLADLYWWLRDSGLHLDPKAALSSSIKPFVPQVLGAGKIAQFRTEASLGAGYYLSLIAAGAALWFTYLRLRVQRPRRERPASAGQAVRASGVAIGVVAAVLLLAQSVAADTLVVQPGGSTTTLALALERASKGDTILVRGGVHPGPLVVRKAVRLVGQDRPIIDGQGRGTVIRLEAPGSELRGFTIRSSGKLLELEDAGVLVAAPEVQIIDNSFEDVLFGVYLRQAPRSRILGNKLHGKDLPIARRGDLIRLWYSDDALIEANTTVGGRDAVLWYSNRLSIRDNHLSEGRYGLHFMYCHDATVVGNRLRCNSVGAFLMYSARLRLGQNWIASNRGVSGYGIGLKDMDDSQVSGNVLVGNKVGIFLEHSRGRFEENLLADNDKGLVIFPSSQGNRFEANTFLENGEQVVIEGLAETMTTNVWRGNFWSDYRGYDADGDGRGDLAYRPLRLFEQLSDRNPALRLFADSPSTRAIDFAARAFPIFEPKSKFADESPRMRPWPAPIVMAGVGNTWHWLVLGTAVLLWPLVLIVARPLAANGPVLLGNWKSRTAGAAPAGRLPPASGPLPAIFVCSLTKRFGKVSALDDLSFEVRQGETVALWGPNGAGKTTVLRCLLGLLPYQGTLRVLGQPCGPRGRASRQLLGSVPQEVRLHVDQSVRETVRFYGRLRRVTSLRVDQLIDEWGLREVEQRPVRHLSGGMKQKLALVVALLSDPPVLLLDEPTSNLDARTRREFGELLERLKAAGKTLLFCTHRPSEVWRLADRVIVLERGRKIADGPPEQVRQALLEPAHLCVTVPADQSTTATERLCDAGFDVRRTGSRLWIAAPAGRKVEAIELLYRAGVSILDLELESDRTQ